MHLVAVAVEPELDAMLEQEGLAFVLVYCKYNYWPSCYIEVAVDHAKWLSAVVQQGSRD